MSIKKIELDYKYGIGDTATIMNDTSKGWLESVVNDMCTYTITNVSRH